ncbi:MAG: hypothetical protein HYZ00_02625 [Candidatus Hydrogenedentes bacterium]|nr:hypothetical protein [Candidatus Hydrogenedentota bacterium]
MQMAVILKTLELMRLFMDRRSIQCFTKMVSPYRAKKSLHICEYLRNLRFKCLFQADRTVAGKSSTFPQPCLYDKGCWNVGNMGETKGQRRNFGQPELPKETSDARLSSFPEMSL